MSGCGVSETGKVLVSGTRTQKSPGAVFLVCILSDTGNGHRHIERNDIPERLQAVDLTFLDPAVEHYVPMTTRNKDRVALTIVF